MSTTTEQQTTKHYVDVWQRETILRRQRIVIEAPSNWDASQLAALDGEELSYWADEYEVNWEIEDCEVLYESNLSGPAPDDSKPNVVLVEEGGRLVEAESGEPAAFTA